ncbi:MAG: methionine--tRNA ligase [Thermoprotei archaeon]|nr:MAG: methionine--tRNA ligase [Thermoprotei archaeon]
MAERLVVTAALPYANGDLHIGHAISTYIPADIYARFKRLQGCDVVFACGSDDHGTPIEVSALKVGRAPLEHARYYHDRHLEDFKRLNISFDNYYYTHSEENRELTEEFLLKAMEGGYIYVKEVEQYYCERDGKFLPDRFVVGTCPYCGAENQFSDLCERCGRVIEPGKILNPKCAICGSTPIRRKSKHFFFKLSAFAKQLEEWLSSSPPRDFPREIVNYVLNWIRSGLEDWDITREDYWGFKLPFKEAADNQYVYVWWDAPIGYIASTVNYCRKAGKDWEAYWKDPSAKRVHFIGKDIAYHHFIFWPAMLLAVGYPLPSKYVVNGYLTLEGEKMSKSRGWLIPLKYILYRYPADYLRFYAAFKAPNSTRDSDFSFKEFQRKVNAELADNIGNYAHRVLTLIHRLHGGVVPEPKDMDEEDEGFKAFIESLPKTFEELYEEADFTRVGDRLLHSFAEANRYLNVKEPWRRGREDPSLAATTMYLSVNFLRDAMIIMYPITPSISSQVLSFIYVEGEPELSWGSLGKFVVKPGTVIAKPKPVVKKIGDEEIEEDLERLKRGFVEE